MAAESRRSGGNAGMEIGQQLERDRLGLQRAAGERLATRDRSVEHTLTPAMHLGKQSISSSNRRYDNGLARFSANSGKC